VLLGATPLLGACGGADDSTVAVAGQEGSTSAATSPQSLLSRSDAATVWTGEALFVFGGVELGVPPGSAPPYADAFLLDPATGEAQSIEPLPFNYPLEQNVGLAASGNSVIALGILCRDRLPEEIAACSPGDLVAAKYVLNEDRWEELALPRLLNEAKNFTRATLGITTAEQIIFDAGPTGSRPIDTAPYWLYDLPSDTWMPLPSPEVRVEDVCLTNDHLVVLTGSLLNAGSVIASPTEQVSGGTLTDPSLRILDLREPEDSSWNATDELTDQMYLDYLLDCGSDYALLQNGLGGDVVVHDVVDAARWMPAEPAPAERFYNEVISVEDRLLFLNTLDGIGYAFTRQSGAWDLIEAPVTQENVTWTGESLVALTPEHPDSGFTVVDVSQ